MSFHIFKNGLARFFSKSSRDQKLQKMLKSLSEKLGHSFSDEKTLRQALKHRSYLTRTGEPRIESNERLELLGDAVLGLVVTDFLYTTFPDEEEGTLTNFKSLLVNRRHLAKVARRFGLGKFLLMNDAEDRAGGRRRESILSDAMESIIGAIYIDGGLAAARKFIKNNITSHLEDLLAEGQILNYKSILLEHCQSANFDGPRYCVEKEDGPDHEKIFSVSAVVNNKKIGFGEGQSKKIAEQNAAKQALIHLSLM
jgi:ribonuclease-3